MPDPRRAWAAILAGGASRRMQTDKAALPTPRGSLLERTWKVLQEAGLMEICVIGRQASGLPVPHYEDATPGLGPLGGLQTALLCCQTPVYLLACDLPLISPAALRWLQEQVRAAPTTATAVVPSDQQRLHPTCAWYSLAMLPRINDAAQKGRRSLQALAQVADAHVAMIPAPLAAAFYNCNTPEDWQQYQSQIKESAP